MTDHPFHRHIPGKELPRVAVFSVDGKKVAQFNGKATPGDVFKAMEKAYEMSYQGSLTKTMGAYRKLLTSMETIRAKKKLLDDKYLTAETRAEEKKLEKELAKLEKSAEKLRAKKERLLEKKLKS